MSSCRKPRVMYYPCPSVTLKVCIISSSHSCLALEEKKDLNYGCFKLSNFTGLKDGKLVPSTPVVSLKLCDGNRPGHFLDRKKIRPVQTSSNVKGFFLLIEDGKFVYSSLPIVYKQSIKKNIIHVTHVLKVFLNLCDELRNKQKF